jgi:hypothetical protein
MSPFPTPAGEKRKLLDGDQPSRDSPRSLHLFSRNIIPLVR